LCSIIDVRDNKWWSLSRFLPTGFSLYLDAHASPWGVIALFQPAQHFPEAH